MSMFKKTEKEIKSLKLSSIEHINKIAIETSSEIVEKIVGTKANSSSVSAIVGDISKKRVDQYPTFIKTWNKYVQIKKESLNSRFWISDFKLS